jgi:hypothetical protein
MVERIKTGTVFIKERIVLPESLRIESEPYSKGWRLVRDLDGGGLDRKAREAGWTLFFMAGEENATVIGPDSERTACRAVKKLLLNTESAGFNCLEISQVAGKGFLGLPCVTACGHARHIQQGMFLVGPQQPAKGFGAELGSVLTQA